jgi:hypothetical protein
MCEDSVFEEQEFEVIDKRGDGEINHPKHYTYGMIEVIEVIEAFGFGPDFCAGNIIKFVSRYKHKGSPLVDLKKARWYLDWLINHIEGTSD